MSPNSAWILEHAHFVVQSVSSVMTLPRASDGKRFSSGVILYVLESIGSYTHLMILFVTDSRDALLAIYFAHSDAAERCLSQLRLSSLTYVRSLIGGPVDGLYAGDIAHTIESLRYSRDALHHQKDILRLDNTLLQSQYTTNKQAFSESVAMQLHENAALRSELERCIDRISHLESVAQTRDETIKGLRESNEQLSSLALRLESQVENARSGRAAPLYSYVDSSVTGYDQHGADIESLRSEVASLRRENARVTNEYHQYKNIVNREYDRFEEFLYHGSIYEMLMHWISCNDLKVEYYETCHLMDPGEHESFCQKIQVAQEELRTSITLARASYINCRTHLFNELLQSLNGGKLEFCRSKRLLTLALERLDWIFQPESSHFDAHEPMWMSKTTFQHLLETLLYKTSEYVWYNKLSYVAALKPVLTNDAASESMMVTLKRQLHDSLTQNESLKQQLASLRKLTGTKGHWKRMWERAVA
eukprot:XP_001609678.1 hypothetical protein [Babesia bovis T2Bo]